MKKILLLGALLIGTSAFAQDNSPFLPETAALFKQLTGVGQTQDGLLALHVARATYDFAVVGGGSGAHGLGVYLPAKAIIKQSWFYVGTQATKTTGSGTMQFSCEDANNIYTAADITGITAGTITAGNETGAASAMVAAIAAPCEITATTAGINAGKLVLFVEYVVGL